MTVINDPQEALVFRASVPDPAAIKTLPFTLEFEYPDGKVVGHTFTAYSDPGAGADLALGSIVRWDSKGKQIIDLNGILTFLDRVMPPDDFARLSLLVDDKELCLPMELLANVFNGLVERYTGRPIMRSTRSSGGPRSTGEASTAPLSSPAQT